MPTQEEIRRATANEAALESQYGPGMGNYIDQQRTIGAVDKNASVLRGVNVDPQDVARTQAGYQVSPYVNEYQDPLLSTVNPEGVYAATNIRSIDIPSTKRAMDMKLKGLEERLAKAGSIAELNQIGIMNQPKAMGVLTGEAAYREKLDTARLNAFNALYQARLAEEERKNTERQNFMTNYGADPNMRPKGMSKREFAKALQAGQFQNLLTTEFKTKQAELQEKLAGPKPTVGEKLGEVAATAQQNLLASKGTDNKVDPGVYVAERAKYMAAGGTAAEFDRDFGSLLSTQEQDTLGISSVATRALNKQTAGGAEAQRTKDNADSGLLSVGDLENEMYNDDGTINRGALIWGVTGMGKLEAARDNIVDAISKIRSGAALSQAEEALYASLVPRVYDSAETIAQKMNQIKALFKFASGGYITIKGADGRVWTFEDMKSEQQRKDIRELINEGGAIVDY